MTNRAPRLDFRRIADTALASLESLLAEWLPHGHREGREYKALNPTRADSREGSFSINLSTGAWADFATDDKGGDAISLYAYLQGIPQGDAARQLADRLGVGAASEAAKGTPACGAALPKASAPSTARRTDWVPILPVPDDAPEPPRAHIKRRFPEASWTYRDIGGRMLGVVYRFKKSGGGKEVLTCCFAEHAKSHKRDWRWMAFPEPRPLYGLDRLKPNGPVLIVEGEKCADAGHSVLADTLSVLTWPGGATAVGRANWDPLRGREVVIWPDCDAQVDKAAGSMLPEAQQPGIKAARSIAKILRGIDCQVRIVEIPSPGVKPSGWDIADAIAEGWGREQLLKFLRPPVSPGKLIRNDKGAIRACEHNASILIGEAPRFRELYFDEFLSRQRLAQRDWMDSDDLELLLWLQGAHSVPGFNLSHARNGARAVAYARRRDSLRLFIETLPKWDGTPRIEMAFIDAWGAADTPLMRSASLNFFIALVARAQRPGSQVDCLWTFEGPQGSFKSRALRELGRNFHAEITAPIGTTDFMRELLGVWIAELSELDSLRGKEASTVKRLLSAPQDRFVQKYALHAESYPRRAVAVATTNEAAYWQDSTGARRLVPIRCGQIRVDLIAECRLQWFAEALARLNSGATWWEFPEVIAQEQESRQQVDPWEDLLRDFMCNGKRGMGADGQGVKLWPESWISSTTIMREWLALPPAQQAQNSSTRLGRVMRRLGYQPERQGKGRERGWARSPEADTCGSPKSEVSAEVSALSSPMKRTPRTPKDT